MRLRRTIAWAVLVLCALLYLRASFHMVTDISEFLPQDASIEQRVMRDVATGKLARQMVLTVRVPDGDNPADVSRQLEELLRQNDAWMHHIAQLNAGTDEDHADALWKLYQSRVPYFFARTPEEAEKQLSEVGLEDAAQRLRTQLQGPTSMLISRVAPTDPFLVLPRLFERIEQAQAGAVKAYEGRLVTEDDRYAVLFVSTHASAFENDVQQEVIHGITDAFHALNATFDHALTLEMSGVNRISIAAQHTIERDIQRISILSAILLLGLLWLVFGGVRVLVLAAMSLGTGVLMALCAVHLLFGQVHGIALAFGASLIGLAVDYVLHLYSHHAEAPAGRSGQDALRRIVPALLIAASSTLSGFIALGFTGFPGLQEVAVFAVAGLGSALLTVMFVVAHWMPAHIPQTRVRRALGDSALRTLTWMRTARWPVAIPLVAVALVVAFGLPNVRWSPRLGDSSEFDRTLVQEEERVRARVSQFDQSRLVVSAAPDIETALQSAEQIADLLTRKPLVEGFASISFFLPSAQRQHVSAERLRSAPELRARFDDAFARAGFRVETFAPFFESLEATLPPPLDVATLADSPLASVIDAFVDETEDRTVILTPIRGVQDVDELRAALEDIPHAVFIDESDMMGDVDGEQRRRIARAMVAGLLVVCGLLFWRYRRPRIVVSALVPSVLSVLWTWSMLAILGLQLDVILVAFSLLIISLGVDYGVFLIDTLHDQGPDLRAAMLGVITAGCTTFIGFGLLAASTFPILHRVGLVALFGVSAAMLLSPLALVLAGTQEPR